MVPYLSCSDLGSDTVTYNVQSPHRFTKTNNAGRGGKYRPTRQVLTEHMSPDPLSRHSVGMIR